MSANILQLSSFRATEQTSWVRSLTTRPFINNDGEVFDPNLAFLLEVAHNTRKFIRDRKAQVARSGAKTPYLPPVLLEHRWDKGRLGDILGAKVARTKTGRWCLYIKVRWTESAWVGIQGRRLKHPSIRVDKGYTDSDGVEYGRIVRELSITERPVLEDLGAIQDTLELRLSRLDLSEEETRKMEETLKEVMDAIRDLMSRVAALEDQAGEGDEGDEEAEAEAAEEMENSRSDDQSQAPAGLTDEQIAQIVQMVEVQLSEPEPEADPLLDEIRQLRQEFAASRRPATNCEDPPREPSPSDGPMSEGKAIELATKEGLSGTALVRRAMELQGIDLEG